MIDLFASSEHYAAHLLPIWRALEARGLSDRSYGSRSFHPWATAHLPRPIDHRGTQHALVASYVDYQRTYPAPVVYVEHGAGQSYDADLASKLHPSYSGGQGFERVVLFICPSERVAERWRAQYPSTPAVAVGCAKLDAWHRATMFHKEHRSDAASAAAREIAGESGRAERAIAPTCGNGARPTGSTTSSDDVTTPAATRGCTSDEGSSNASRARSAVSEPRCTTTTTTGRSTCAGCVESTISPTMSGNSSRPVVAVTFHWDCPLVPESLSAWRHYDAELARLAEWARFEGVELLGHGHPRLWHRIAERWRRLGVESVEQFDVVLDRASLLVFDNTSAGFEFASCDRPVVVLNAPWYRRDVEHGGRFWRWANVGLQCDAPRDLSSTIERALDDSDDQQRMNRRAVVAEVYSAVDGHAAHRAADAIEGVLNDSIHGQRGRVDPRGF